MDSEDADLIYILSQDPTFGKLQLERGGADGLVDVHANGDVDRFTQADIDNGEAELGILFFNPSMLIPLLK